MIEFTVKHSALTCQWGLKDTFIPLPEPGDPEFADLYRNLRPFQVAFGSISFKPDAETLADERMVISLLNNRLTLRLAYGGFDFLLNGMNEGEESLVSDLIQAIHPVLLSLGGNLAEGQVRFVYEAFFKLNEMSIEEFLGQYLPARSDTAQLLPDTLAYQVVLREGQTTPQVRFLMARSNASGFPGTLYTHITFDYTEIGDIDRFMAQVTDDWHQTMASLNLKLNNLEDEEHAAT